MMTLNYNYNILNGDEDDADTDANADADANVNADESGPEQYTETGTESEAQFDNNTFDTDYEMATEMDAVLINDQDDGSDDEANQKIITRSESPLIIERSRKSRISSEDLDIAKDRQTFVDDEKSQKNKDLNKKDSRTLTTKTTTTTMNPFKRNNNFASLHNLLPVLKNTATSATATFSSQRVQVSGKDFHQQVELNARTTTKNGAHKSLLFPNDKNRHMGPLGLGATADTAPSRRGRGRGRSKPQRRHRLTKAYSTLFCEGYNVEQRNCNIFECSGEHLIFPNSSSFHFQVILLLLLLYAKDDISDLLKFYRKPYVTEDNVAPINGNHQIGSGYVSLPSLQSLQQQPINAVEINDGVNVGPTTPANMGYINSWFNSLNFTIMLTLRVKVGEPN